MIQDFLKKGFKASRKSASLFLLWCEVIFSTNRVFNRLFFYSLMAVTAGFAADSALHGDDWKPDAQTTISYLEEEEAQRTLEEVTDEKRQAWQKEYDFHLLNAIRCYCDARDYVWSNPATSFKETAKLCFTNVVSKQKLKTPTRKLVAGTIMQLSQQEGLDSSDEWNFVYNKLRWSGYHFELCEYYWDLLYKS